MATPELIKEFRDYVDKGLGVPHTEYVNSGVLVMDKNGIRCCDAVKELDLIYKKAVIKERKENLEKDFTDETEGT